MGRLSPVLAAGLAVLFVRALDGTLRDGGGRRGALVAGLLLALVLATSHLVAVPAVLAGVAVVGFHQAWRPRPDPDGGGRGGSLVRTLGWVVLPTLPLVPLYVRLAGVATSVAARDPRPSSAWATCPDSSGCSTPTCPPSDWP